MKLIILVKNKKTPEISFVIWYLKTNKMTSPPHSYPAFSKPAIDQKGSVVTIPLN